MNQAGLSDPFTMTQATCTVIAGLLPVFLLVIVLSGGMFDPDSKKPGARKPPQSVWGKVAVTAYIALFFGVEVLVVVGGTDKGGLNGALAGIAWVMFFAAIFMVAADAIQRVWKTPRD